MSSVPFEPEAPPQRALYMHEVYSRARLASTDEAVCRYCEGMALLSEPCNGPSPLSVHQLFARIGDKDSPSTTTARGRHSRGDEGRDAEAAFACGTTRKAKSYCRILYFVA